MKLPGEACAADSGGGDIFLWCPRGTGRRIGRLQQSFVRVRTAYSASAFDAQPPWMCVAAVVMPLSLCCHGLRAWRRGRRWKGMVLHLLLEQQRQRGDGLGAHRRRSIPHRRRAHARRHQLYLPQQGLPQERGRHPCRRVSILPQNAVPQGPQLQGRLRGRRSLKLWLVRSGKLRDMSKHTPSNVLSILLLLMT